jgi:hypothetical protein
VGKHIADCNVFSMLYFIYMKIDHLIIRGGPGVAAWASVFGWGGDVRLSGDVLVMVAKIFFIFSRFSMI